MPTLDGGHYFLTTLIPVKVEPVGRPDGSVTVPSHRLRSILATLPTAQQSPATVAVGFVSPFAHCTRTHFSRFVVIDQPMYNGRDPDDAIVQALRKVNLLAHQPVDTLSRPWLLFTADFDAREAESDGGLASWAADLWKRTEPELRTVFENCVGFEHVKSGADFAAWLKRCQLPTIMSFNDYYVPGPNLSGYTLGQIAGIAAGVFIAMLAAGWLLCVTGWWGGAWLLLGAVVAVTVPLALLWMKGSKPYPAGADTDLPSVLKALHVQQRFALLVADLQGMDEDTIHTRFAQFLGETQPADVSGPTQEPGVIRSDGIALVKHAEVQAKVNMA